MTTDQWIAWREAQAAAAASEAEVNAATATPAATRAALKQAVRRYLDAEAAVPKLAAAADGAVTDVYAARRARDEAQATVAKATEIDADALAEAVLSGVAPASQMSEYAAREALAAAEEGLTRAVKIRAALESKADEAKQTLSFATNGVRQAAIATIRAHSARSISAFVADTEHLMATLAIRARGVQWLLRNGLLDRSSPAIRFDGFFASQPSSWTLPPAHAAAEITASWDATLANLTRDPAAPAEIAAPAAARAMLPK